MNTGVAKKVESLPALGMSEEDLMQVLRNSLYPGAQDESIKMVIGYCRASGLDPMQKPVHIVPIWDSKAKQMRDVIMPGIGSYRTQAARSGQYAGVSEPEFGADTEETLGGVKIVYPAWCKVSVKRLLPNGSIAEFSAIERWKENYAAKGGTEKSIAPNSMWTKRPFAQLAKCSEAQALRKAFPELGAAPTADEMEGRILDESATVIDGNTGEIIGKAKELPEYTEAQMTLNLPAWQTAINAGKVTPQKILAMVSTKFQLLPEQAETIRALTKQKIEDSFVAEMEAAEKQQGAA